MKKIKYSFYQGRRLAIVILIILVVGFASYGSGYSKGTLNVLYLMAEKIPDMVDIQLTPRAKWALLSQPKFLYYILTPESVEKLLSDMNMSADAKGGIGSSIIRDIELEGGLGLNDE